MRSTVGEVVHTQRAAGSLNSGGWLEGLAGERQEAAGRESEDTKVAQGTAAVGQQQGRVARRDVIRQPEPLTAHPCHEGSGKSGQSELIIQESRVAYSGGGGGNGGSHVAVGEIQRGPLPTAQGCTLFAALYAAASFFFFFFFFSAFSSAATGASSSAASAFRFLRGCRVQGQSIG